MVNSPSQHADEDLPKRLKALRKAEGYLTSKAFADYLGLKYPRYNNFETGEPLSIEAATIIVEKVPGVTLDWLYLNREEGLTISLRERLRAAMRPADTRRTVRSRG